MNERYSIIYSLPHCSHQVGLPIVICGGNLLKDNTNQLLFVQIKLQSISVKVIHEIEVIINKCDTHGNVIQSQIHSFNWLNLARDQFVGEDYAIPLNSTDGESFSIEVSKIVFYDESVLFGDNKELITIPNQMPLRTNLNNDWELEKQYQLEKGNSQQYAPIELTDIWLCSCGAVNLSEESACHLCNTNRIDVFHPDIPGLESRKDKRIAVEKKKEKEKRKKRRQLGITISIIAITVVILAALIHFLIVPMSRYNKAVQAINNEEYQTAYDLLRANLSFRDSEDKMNTLVRDYWIREYSKILTEGYDEEDGGYGPIIPAEDKSDGRELFALAYIDYDEIPELLVSPDGRFGYVFTIKSEEYLGNVNMVNAGLPLDTDDYNEIGYFQGYGYIYHLSSGKEGYRDETWCPLDENGGPDWVSLNAYTEIYDFGGEYTEYYAEYEPGNAGEVSADEFDELLHAHIDKDKYQKFNLLKNNDSNRQKAIADLESKTGA